MGIRMLHRRTPEAHIRAAWQGISSTQARLPVSPVPALAVGASTVRVPVDLARTVRRATAHLRRRCAGTAARADRVPDWRQWADLARGYLALALTLVPRTRPRPTLTVFVASLTDRRAGSGPQRSSRRDPRDRPAPGPDATP
ncbi:hypothetical protein ACQ4WX_14960 [Streptomyces lasalocidi]